MTSELYNKKCHKALVYPLSTSFRGGVAVILLPAHPASFAHNFVSGVQSVCFSESQDAIVLQTYH